MALSEREQRLLYITLIVVVIGGIAIGWGMLKKGTDSVSSETVTRLDTLFEEMDSVEAQKQRNLLLKNKLGNPHGRFITKTEITPLLAEIEEIAQRSGGVKIKGFNPDLNNKPQPLPKLEVDLNLECRFESLIQFLDNVKTGEYILLPYSLRTSLKDKNRPDLDVHMTLITYVTDQRPAAAGATALVSRGEQ
jgi:Tfp pilus assembly protein PilO